MRKVVSVFGVALLVSAGTAVAKPPVVNRFFPAGVQVGTETVLDVAGSFDDWPVEGISHPAGLELTPAEEKGKLTVRVPEETAPGVYLVRLASAAGVSAWKPLVVGRRPEVMEVEPNNSLTNAQPLESTSLVVNGKLAGGQDVDVFAVTLAAEETLVVSVLANEVLGSPMDSVVQVCDSRGFVLAQNDDEIGFDSRLAFKAPIDSVYFVRLFAFPAAPNSTIAFSASDDYVYRLTLTTGPFADHVLPLALPRSESPADMELAGWNLDPATRFVAAAPAGEDEAWRRIAHEAVSESFIVPVVPYPSVVVESQSGEAEPLEVSLPIVVSGRIEAPGAGDVVRFAGKKDEKLVIRVESRSLGFALDPVARISSADGRKLAEMDDASRNERDVLLTYTIPEDGTYELSIRDLHGEGGLRYSYRATLEYETPQFQLSTPNDALVVKQGETIDLPLEVAPQHGFKSPLEIFLEGLPDELTWEIAAAEGESERPRGEGRESGRRRGRRGASADASTKITVKLTGNVEPGHYRFRVQAEAGEEGPSGTLRFQSAGLFHEEVWLTVTP